MDTLAGFPYVEVQFDRRGAVVDPAQVTAAQALVRDGPLDDLLILVHGWNSTPEAARGRYTRYLEHARTLLGGELQAPFQNRRLGALGIVWPSVPDALHEPPLQVPLETTVTAALSAFPGDTHPQMHAALTDLQSSSSRPPTPDQLDAVRSAALTEVVTSSTYTHEPMVPGRNLTSEHIDAVLRQPVTEPSSVKAALWVDSGGNPISTFLRQLIVFASYYQMKDRAGFIGQSGARGLLNDLRRVRPGVRLHLLGHSFGGRLVTAAARGQDDDPALPIDSLHIIQGAFSHYSFAQATPSTPEGYFLRVVTEAQVRGPILVTHTANDLAVGIAYVIASALAGQTDRFRAVENLYGAIGNDGARRTPAQQLILSDDLPLNFQGGTVYNLQADMIPNHGDVEQLGVVRAVLYGVLAT